MPMTPDIISLIALTLGASWASGINLYAAILTLGIMGSTGTVNLPIGLDVLSHPMVLGAAGLMYAIEFFADKIPGVDSAWDSIHTFIRIPAGVMLAYGATSEIGLPVQVAASIIGGSLAATSHATKAGSRLLINTSPEPVTNWTASILEDVTVVGGLYAAMHYPILFLIGLVLFLLAMIWILPKIWRGIKALARKIGGWLGLTSQKPVEKQELITSSASITPSNNIEPQSVSQEDGAGI